MCPGESTTAAGNQHLENTNNVEVSCEMAMETTMEHTEELEECEMEQDWTNPNTNKREVGRDNDKIWEKGDKPNHSYNDERTDKENDDYGPDVGNTLTTQPKSPKSTKKIKVNRDPPTPREGTRSKTRLQTPQRS
jgi:hypothetical protein